MLLQLAIGSDDELSICVPARFKLCSGEMRLVIPREHDAQLRARPNPALIKALARPHVWKNMLVSGAAPSVRAIARQESMTHRYVGRILRLAFLAPDIMETILDGYQPGDLELEHLLEGIPLLWSDQRRRLGFRMPESLLTTAPDNNGIGANP